MYCAQYGKEVMGVVVYWCQYIAFRFQIKTERKCSDQKWLFLNAESFINLTTGVVAKGPFHGFNHIHFMRYDDLITCLNGTG